MRKRGILTELILCLLTACLLSGAALGADADPAPETSGTLSTGLTWALNAHVLTISGKGAIPSFTEASPAPWAAAQNQTATAVQTITLSGGITTIGDYAFTGCTNLRSVTIPATVTSVGAHAFENCSRLSSVTLPQGVGTVGDFAFSGCSSLGSVSFPANLTTVGVSAFSNCKGLSAAVFLEGLTAIGDSAFYGCTGLRTLQLPNNGGITIGASAFYDTNLGASQTGIWLPPSITSIGDSAFSKCGTNVSLHYFASTTGEIHPAEGVTMQVHFLEVIGTPRITEACTNSPTTSKRITQYHCLTPTCGKLSTQTDDLGKPPCTYVSVEQKATCLIDGYEGEQCPICHTFRTKTTLPAPGSHDYGATETTPVIDPDASYDATCTAKGLNTYVKKCQRDGCGYQEVVKTEDVAVLDHTKPVNTSEIKVTELDATCSRAKTTITSYTCTVCNTAVTEEKTDGDPLGQNCAKEYHNLGETTYENVTEATCETAGERKATTVCEDCGRKFEETEYPEALGHAKPSDDYIFHDPNGRVDATCTVKGSESITYTCTRCGKKITEPVEIDLLPHTEVPIEDVPATCNTPGKTGGVECSVCHTVIKEPALTPKDPKNHKLYKQKEFDDSKPATCTEPGLEHAIWACEYERVCGLKPYEESKVLESLGGHKRDETVPLRETEVPPTCTEAGYKVSMAVCSECHAEYEFEKGAETDPALGHDFGEWVNVTESDGIVFQERTCRKCDFKETRFIVPTYLVTLNLEGGTLPDGTNTILETGEDGKLKEPLPTPTRTDYRFEGWYDAEKDGKRVDDTTVFTKDVSLFAYWTSTKMPDDGWTVTFDPNGGALAQESDKTAKTGADGKLTGELPTPTLADNRFLGWFDAKEGGKQVDKDTVYTGHTTLYAHWTKEAAPGEGFTITLDANEGTLDGDVKTVTTGQDGKLAALPKDPTRSGYLFDGWYDAVTGGNKITTSTVFTGDSTIYARWTQDDGTTYAIRTDSTDHGKLTPSVSTAARGTTVTVYADPDSGYRLSSIQVTDGSGNRVTTTRQTDTRYTFTMPGSLVNITGSFTRDTSSSDVQDPSSGSWNTGAVWNTTDTSKVPDPVPTPQSVPQINAYGQAFRDVPQGHWAAGEIAWTAQNGYMNGIGGGLFAPNRAISHQQLWTVLTRLLRYTNVSDTNLQSVRQGLLDGGNPGAPTTRQQMVTALYRCAFLLGGARQPSVDIKSYPDSARVSGYAREAMSWAVTNGILTGTSDGRLNPEGTVTRAQFAVFLFRFSQRYR